MSEMTRVKSKYPGVFYINAKGVNGSEKIYYIRYRKDGKLIEEKVGRQYQDDMTPARANNIRSEKIEGHQKTNSERRTEEQAAKRADDCRWTFNRLFGRYLKERTITKLAEEEMKIIDDYDLEKIFAELKFNSPTQIDISRYKKFIKKPFGDKETNEIILWDVDRLRLKLSKTYKPQSVKHVLNLITRIANYGHKKGLCEGIGFTVQKPRVDNLVTEDLSPDQLRRLLIAIEADTNRSVADMMLMALNTGMRRGELLKLQWDDINLNTGFITIRAPKGGRDAMIPLSQKARELLESINRTESPFVFPGDKGNQRTQMYPAVSRIKKRAGLPKDFRPMHGLRHAFASMLASSGQVDIYTLQKLMTHKDFKMTQRYAHLRDETLKKASDLVGDILDEARKEKKSATNG